MDIRLSSREKITRGKRKQSKKYGGQMDCPPFLLNIEKKKKLKVFFAAFPQKSGRRAWDEKSHKYGTKPYLRQLKSVLFRAKRLCTAVSFYLDEAVGVAESSVRIRCAVLTGGDSVICSTCFFSMIQSYFYSF